MAYVSDLFDQLRDHLNDATDTQVPFTTKKLYLNRGIQRLWPKVYRIVNEQITVLADTYEYTLDAAVADGRVLSVEVLRYGAEVTTRYPYYDIIPGDEDNAGIFRLQSFVPPAGSTIFIRYAAPIPLIAAADYTAAQAETWNGPDRALGLPALYAMSLITGRRFDDRLDYTRYTTTQGQNGVDETTIMQVASFWMNQFEVELEQAERPLPFARD